MYGLEGILGNLVTSVATPAIGGIVGDVVSKEIEDQLLKEITQTTAGALSGAAVGAGLGALTGGKSGAMSGALTGGVGGGVGGYNAPQISQMFGMDQGVGAPQAGQITPQASPMPPVSNAQMMQQDPTLAAISPKQSPAQLNAVRNAMPATAQQNPIQNIQAPTPQAPTQQPSAFKGYADFLKQNYEPLAGGFFLGSSIGATQDTNEQAKKYKQQNALMDLINQRNARGFAQSLYGYADGGPVEVGLANPQINVHFPAWAQEDIQREGGLAALQPGIKQGMATGGYVNVHPFDPQEFHPQSQIPSAQPYAGAAPTSVVNTLSEGASFARGGLIDGHGDGMSDSIPANIGGREPVKVADGEYLIPREIAHKYGPEKLKAAMTKIRAAAHAKKGQQVKQDAGKRALISTLGGIKA